MNIEISHHKFEIDESVVATLIHSQNGCPGRAIVELITNAVDAGSRECSIRLTEKAFCVADLGDGFRSKKDVMRYFKRFGTPHKDGDAKFGRFRLGRGQIMQFGEVTWQSRAHEMTTNIQANGYGFDYRELSGDEIVKGCRVEGVFYCPLTRWDLHQAKQVIIKTCRYLDVSIFMNGEQLNRQEDITWDFENNDFRIQWKKDDSDTQGVRIYNQGALVKEIARGVFGLGADVVTKKSLKLNISRNDVVTTDPLWTSIDNVLADGSAKHRKHQAQKNKMNEDLRRSMISQLRAGIIDFQEVSRQPLLRDARGRYVKISALSERPVTLSPSIDNRAVETIMMQKIAMVLHHTELDFWQVENLHELFYFLLIEAPAHSDERNSGYYLKIYERLNFIEFDIVATMINTETKIIPNKGLNPRESAARNALQYASGIMAKRISNASTQKAVRRKVVVGESLDKDAWTDTQSFIAINRSLDQGRPGAFQLASLMLHEYCHDIDHPNTSKHGEVFYERYHDLSLTQGKHEILGHTATSLYTEYSSQLIKKFELLPKAVISEFNWPVINEQGMFECWLSPKGLSRFAKRTLKIAGVKTKLSSRKLVVSYPTRKNEDISKRISKYLKEVVIPEVNMGSLDSVERSRDWEEGISLKKALIEKAAKAWAKKNDFDPDAVVMFLSMNGSDIGRLEFLLRVICKDSHSGLLAYESTSISRSLKVGGPKYRYENLSVYQYSGFTPDGCRRDIVDGMKTSSSDRNAFAIARIKEVILSVSDETERQQLLDKVFAADFSDQFKCSLKSMDEI